MPHASFGGDAKRVVYQMVRKSCRCRGRRFKAWVYGFVKTKRYSLNVSCACEAAECISTADIRAVCPICLAGQGSEVEKIHVKGEEMPVEGGGRGINGFGRQNG